MSDFYFIYTLIGPHYLKSLVRMLQSVPETTNIVVVTNTPELLDNVSVPCNLIVVDLESLRDDIDRKNEPIIYSTDEDEYCRLMTEKGGFFSFPVNIHRHALKWCVDNNITKLVLADVGCYPTPHLDKSIDLFNKTTQDEKCSKNLILAHPNILNNVDDFAERMRIECEELPGFDTLAVKFGLDIHGPSKNYNMVHHVSSEVDNFGDQKGVLIIGSDKGFIDLDGYAFGFYFEDKNLLLDFYNFWHEYTRLNYLHSKKIFYSPLRPSGGNGYVGYEQVISFATELFSKFRNVTISSLQLVVHHERRPENDPSLSNIKFEDCWYIQTTTQKQFFEANRELLIASYGPGRLKLFGLDEVLNYREEELPEIIDRYNKLLKLPEHLPRDGWRERNREFLIYCHGPEKIKKYGLEKELNFNPDEWDTIKEKYDTLINKI